MSVIRKLGSFIFSRYFLKQLGLIVLFYLELTLGLMRYLLFSSNHGEKIAVPNVVGKNAADAKGILEDLGLAYQILDSIYDPTKPAGTIVAQNPQPTALSLVYVKPGRMISLRVTKPTNFVEMPACVDRPLRFVQDILRTRGLKYEIKYELSEEANGAVMRQLFRGAEIKEGAKIPIGSTILLIVGQRVDIQVEVPDLIGKDFVTAKAILDSMGIKVQYGFTECYNQEDSLAATVYRQSPEFLPGETTSKSTIFILQLGIGIDPEEEEEEFDENGNPIEKPERPKIEGRSELERNSNK